MIHGKKGCPEAMHRRTLKGNGEKQWDTWLRADLPKRQGNSSQGFARQGNGGNDSFSCQEEAKGSPSSGVSPAKSRSGGGGNPSSQTKFYDEGGSADSEIGVSGGGKQAHNEEEMGKFYKEDIHVSTGQTIREKTRSKNTSM